MKNYKRLQAKDHLRHHTHKQMITLTQILICGKMRIGLWHCLIVEFCYGGDKPSHSMGGTFLSNYRISLYQLTLPSLSTHTST
jgi:hypothetical protein